MANGDLSSPEVLPSGFEAEVAVAGVAIGGTFAFGLGTNNDPTTGSPKFVLSVSSPGFSGGIATTVNRTIYAVPDLNVGAERFPFGTVFLTGVYVLGTFEDGETITQAVSGATGIIVGRQSSGTRLIFRAVTGTFNNVNVCTGGTSGATFTSASTISTYAVPSAHVRPTSAGVILRLVLSDYIYSGDTILSCTALAGLYTQGGTPSNAASLFITNNTAAVHQKVVGNWSWPGFQRISGATATVRGVFFHRCGIRNLGMDCVVFTGTDEHGHSSSITVSDCGIDQTMLDLVPVIEFFGPVSTSPWTQGDVITWSFDAYPIVGDSGSVLSSSAGTAQPTPLYGPITDICDKTGAYGRTFAACQASGDDTTGIAVDRASYASDALADAAALATPCKTIGGAYAKIAAYNNANHGRNNAGAGEIIGINENYAWPGGGSGSNAVTWPIFRPATGYTTAQVVINAGASSLGAIMKLQGITISGNAAFIFYNINNLWLDQCILSATGASVFDDPVKALYVTRCNLNGFAQGLRPSSGGYNMAPAIVRGNSLDNFLNGIIVYMVVGNSGSPGSAPVTGLFSNYRGGGQTIPTSVNCVIAFNKILKFQTDSVACLTMGDPFVNTHGFAFVQNVFENVLGNAVGVVSMVENDTSTPFNNGIIWNNTIVGGKWNNDYNSVGSTSLSRLYWSVKNNLAVDINIKSDTFPTANGNRQGNWSGIYGVGASGNFWPEITGVGASGNFVFNFPGLKSYQPTINGEPPQCTPNAVGFIQFTDDQSYTGTTSPTAGGGTYTLQATSPAIAIQLEKVVPYDLAGIARTDTDAAGAYHFGTSSSGGRFGQGRFHYGRFAHHALTLAS